MLPQSYSIPSNMKQNIAAERICVNGIYVVYMKNCIELNMVVFDTIKRKYFDGIYFCV